MSAEDERAAQQSPATPRRTRRSSGEVRTAILLAAEELFADNGYAGTSTRAIARRCGVAEHLIFRHFGSKSALFDAAVRAPFEEFLNEYTTAWATQSESVEDVYDRSGVYLAGLYDRLAANRQLWLAILRGEDADRDGPANGAESPVSRFLDKAEQVAAVPLHRIGANSVDTHVFVRATFAMVIGMVMFDEWLFPPGDHPDRSRILREMQEIVVNGLAHRG